jgi:hypothetical protein
MDLRKQKWTLYVIKCMNEKCGKHEGNYNS